MSISKEVEKSYTLLIEGLTLEEKSWLYKRSKIQGISQGEIVRFLIRDEIMHNGESK